MIVYRSPFAGSEHLTLTLFTKFERVMATGCNRKSLNSFSPVYFGVERATALFHAGLLLVLLLQANRQMNSLLVGMVPTTFVKPVGWEN